MPIGPAPGHQHVFADEIEGERGVDGIAERIEDRCDLVRDIVGDGNDIGFRNADELAEGARPVDADAERIAAQMPPARHGSCGTCRRRYGLRRRHVRRRWYLVTAEPISAISPDEFVTDHHRHRNGLLRPLIPVPDMHVRAADRRFLHPDQHVVRADFRHRHVLHPEADFGLRLDQCFHHVGHDLFSPQGS